MPENDSVLDELNMGCVDCQDQAPAPVACSTTTFAAVAPAVATATVVPASQDPYTVCCDPVAIKPVSFAICSRGSVRNIKYVVTTLPTKGKLYIGDEEVEEDDELTEQENGLLVYVRDIDEEAEDGVQAADTDTIGITIQTSGGNSAELVISLVLEEATCFKPSPCEGCNC